MKNLVLKSKYLVILISLVISACTKSPFEAKLSPGVSQPSTPADETVVADRFARVDRMGMPAIATAVITNKDAYNAATPADDANGIFVDEIVSAVGVFHSALDDDLTGLGLTPCAVSDCVAAAAPLIVPDVITIDPSQASGFPNGRQPQEQVMDITLALLLLDLTQHPITLFADLPLNPATNDLNFSTEFPYLASPHEVN